MAETTLNDQVTDAVAEANASVLGQGPTGSQGLVDAVMAETVGMVMHNAVAAQHNSQMVSGAAVAATCARILRTTSGPPPVLKVMVPAGPPAGSGDDGARIAQSGREARRALATLLREAQSASRNAADAQEHLHALATHVGRAHPTQAGGAPGGHDVFGGN